MQANFVLELPNDVGAIERAVDTLMARCQEVGFDCDGVCLKLRVGVTEALANAMLYGNARDPRKRVLVEATLSTHAVTVRVTDEGCGFDPDAVPDPTLPCNRLRPGGRGIFLIRRLMDRVEFNERGNSITMVLHGGSSSSAERPWER
ncbi:MAG TPA: ATP-binding protein [Longimicrobiales bacterium]